MLFRVSRGLGLRAVRWDDPALPFSVMSVRPCTLQGYNQG